jgi:hypothetical protein
MANRGNQQTDSGMQKNKGPAQQRGSGKPARSSVEDEDLDKTNDADVDDDFDANRDANDRDSTGSR